VWHDVCTCENERVYVFFEWFFRARHGCELKGRDVQVTWKSKRGPREIEMVLARIKSTSFRMTSMYRRMYIARLIDLSI